MLRRKLFGDVSGYALRSTSNDTPGQHPAVPPFVETEPGMERVVDPVAVTYKTDAGTVLDCKLYLEFTDVTEAQREALNSLSINSLWRNFAGRSVRRR